MKDPQGRNHYAMEPFMPPPEAGGAGATLLERRMSEWGECEDVALENLKWYEENCQQPSGRAAHHNQSSILDTVIYDIFNELLSQPPARTYWALRMILYRAPIAYAKLLINHETPANWCDRMGVSKQAAYKECNEICDLLGFPLDENQRKEESRAKMREKRMAPANAKSAAKKPLAKSVLDMQKHYLGVGH